MCSVLVCLLVEGYLLIEDVFGVGKMMFVCVFVVSVDVIVCWI